MTLLHRETIETSSLVGAVVAVVLQQAHVVNTVAALVGGAVVIATRTISTQFHLNLPKFKK